MNVLAILLVLASAVVHASWNLLAKRSGNKLAFLWAINIAAITIYLPVFLVFVRDHPIPAEGWPFIVATSVINCIYVATLSQAYAHGALSVAYPISRGTGAVLVPILAVPLLGEQVSFGGGLGIGLVILGILVLHLDALRDLMAEPLGIIGSRVRPEERRIGTLFALLTGVGIASYSLVDKAGVERVHPVVYGYLIFVGITVGLAPFTLARLRPAVAQEWRSNRASVLAAGTMMLGTYLIVLGAMRIAQVSYIVPLRETSVLVAAVLGAVFLNEEFNRRRIVACVLIALGVITISLFG